jgi:hypothetical protein
MVARRGDDALGFIKIRLIGEHHAAQAQGRYFQITGTQTSILHCFPLRLTAPSETAR